MRAGVYLRISRDDGETLAISRQRADCQRLCAERGWTIVREYADVSLSAFSGVQRPEFERIMADVEAGAVDVIVAYRLDRLVRRVEDNERLLATKAEVALVDHPVDRESVPGRTLLRITAAMAQAESETTSLRIRRQKADAAAEGRPNGGGRRPFGHIYDQTELVEDEAALIREAAERVLAGEAVYGICQSWAERGVRGSAGAAVRPSTLVAVLRSPRMIGRRTHRGQAIPSEVIVPILDEVTWRRVRDVLDSRRGTQGRANRKLSGLVVCGRCGSRMHISRRLNASGTPGDVYRCTRLPGSERCGRTTVVADRLEALVGEALALAVDEEGLAQAIARTSGSAGRAAELLAAAEEVRGRLAQLAEDHYVAALIGREEFLAARSGLQAKLAGFEAELARVSRSSALSTLATGETLRDAWAQRSPGWCRELARALLEAVVIKPVGKAAVGFDPRRVSLRWRAE